jgi:hypothetical protein
MVNYKLFIGAVTALNHWGLMPRKGVGGTPLKQVFVIAAAVAALTVGASSAYASSAVSITVSTTLAPNTFGSPSYAPWVQNAINAQDAGLSTLGAAGPTQFNTTGATMNVTASQGIVTGFNSWMGVADPAAPYQSELGNRMSFSLVVNGNGQQLEIDKLSFNATSSDAGNVLGFGFGEGDYAYSSDYVGVDFGADGHLGGGDDTFITSGPANQLVDAIIGRGSGNSIAALCVGCSPADQQAAIDAQAAYWTSPATFTGTYTYDNGATGSGTFNIAAAGVPEPAAWTLMIVGFGAAGATLRRRKLATA